MALGSTSPPAVPVSNVILWQDIFFAVDNGKVPVAAYDNFEQRISEQARQFPGGVGGLAIIPANATPPPEDVRKAINQALASLDHSLKSFCWLVEGSGFQAAMVRGVLTGLRMFGRRSYPTFITDSLGEALAWTLPHLAGGLGRLPQVTSVAAIIQKQRGGPAMRALR